MAVNLKELSARLGLSPTTVSRALSGYDDVSATTRERVLQLARELGYRPNLAARQIALGRSDAVGIVYPLQAEYLGNPSFLDTLAGLSDRLEQSGLDLLLAAAQPSGEMRTYDRIVRGRRVDALIVAQTLVADERIEYLLESGMPFVAYGRSAAPHRYPWFDFDNEAGSRLAVERIVAAGHRRIAYVHLPMRWNFAAGRHAGFVAAMRAAGLAVDPALVIESGFSRRDGYLAAQRLLALPQRPTAVLADGNLNGMGVLRALFDSGIEIGRDLSVVIDEGVPDDALVRGLKVASVVQPTPYGSGQRLAEMVLDLVEGRAIDVPHDLRQPQFVDGSSLGAPSHDDR